MQPTLALRAPPPPPVSLCLHRRRRPPRPRRFEEAARGVRPELPELHDPAALQPQAAVLQLLLTPSQRQFLASLPLAADPCRPAPLQTRLSPHPRRRQRRPVGLPHRRLQMLRLSALLTPTILVHPPPCPPPAPLVPPPCPAGPAPTATLCGRSVRDWSPHCRRRRPVLRPCAAPLMTAGISPPSWMPCRARWWRPPSRWVCATRWMRA